jgi:hypothetical protein
MAKRKKRPVGREELKRRKQQVLLTRGKNAAGQTNGQFERDPRRRTGNFEGAGDPPRMQM